MRSLISMCTQSDIDAREKSAIDKMSQAIAGRVTKQIATILFVKHVINVNNYLLALFRNVRFICYSFEFINYAIKY